MLANLYLASVVAPSWSLNIFPSSSRTARNSSCPSQVLTDSKSNEVDSRGIPRTACFPFASPDRRGHRLVSYDHLNKAGRLTNDCLRPGSSDNFRTVFETKRRAHLDRSFGIYLSMSIEAKCIDRHALRGDSSDRSVKFEINLQKRNRFRTLPLPLLLTSLIDSSVQLDQLVFIREGQDERSQASERVWRSRSYQWFTKRKETQRVSLPSPL